jgi:hypothetical protein
MSDTCVTCGGRKWICTIPDDDAAHEHNRCNHDPGRCPDCRPIPPVAWTPPLNWMPR